MSPAEMVLYLDGQIDRVENGAAHESACATIVARSMRGIPIRPKLVDHRPDGFKHYLLNVSQAKKLRAAIIGSLPTEGAE